MPAAVYSNIMPNVSGKSLTALKNDHFSLSDETMNPPSFDRKVDSYAKWKRKLGLWLNITDIAKTKLAALIILRLDDDTQDVVLDVLREEDIMSEGGVEKVLDELDNIFQIDPCITAYEDYKEFVSYQRPEYLSVNEFCRQFERKLKKVESAGTKLADNVLAYKLLKSASLERNNELLIKAIVTEMKYAEVMYQLKRVFNYSSTCGNLASESKDMYQIKDVAEFRSSNVTSRKVVFMDSEDCDNEASGDPQKSGEPNRKTSMEVQELPLPKLVPTIFEFKKSHVSEEGTLRNIADIKAHMTNKLEEEAVNNYCKCGEQKIDGSLDNSKTGTVVYSQKTVMGVLPQVTSNSSGSLKPAVFISMSHNMRRLQPSLSKLTRCRTRRSVRSKVVINSRNEKQEKNPWMRRKKKYFAKRNVKYQIVRGKKKLFFKNQRSCQWMRKKMKVLYKTSGQKKRRARYKTGHFK